VRHANLDQLLYSFHEDWKLDASTADDVVSRYACDSPEDHLRLVARELDDLLATSDEPALERYLDEIGCQYTPSVHGQTNRAWLQHVRALLGQ
jgi:hypothetical protein